MTTYKTPDVYVEEISIFPPSVAEVETAIPAFIGYTEKAQKINTDDLINKPTRISSLLDFQRLFGYGPPANVSSVVLDATNAVKKVELVTTYYLYDSLRLFYANGGGDCYIVAVGKYPASPSDTDFNNGLTALEKYDEPTIILFPDAVNLTGTKLYALQDKALDQCRRLMDRVAVFDLKQNTLSFDAFADFRNNIGIKYLKYGMAYTPWLNISLPKNVSYNEVKPAIQKSGSSVSLKSLTADTKAMALIDEYDQLLADIVTTNNNIKALFGNGKTFRQAFDTKVAAYDANPKTDDELEDIIKLLFDTADMVDNWANTATNAKLKTALGSFIESQLSVYFAQLVLLNNEAKENANGITGYTSPLTAANYTHPKWNNIFASNGVSDVFANADTNEAKMDKVLVKVKQLFEQINATFNDIQTFIATLENTNETDLADSLPVYKDIINSINDTATAIPPSGPVVGNYAATDRDRGVWKAPANVSISSVNGPSEIYTVAELEKLNIDVDGGKSINAIRAFTGRGTLIWGARTLAGNDNEWRYIPVRRFYNMVEESIKKSTYWAVFEPNDANTWVKVKGMIENYLTNKWKEGALVGAKPDEAFFVKIGLGSTMSAQDILNGYMNIEIGMAVARPAEFIVLKFSHKLQQS